MDLKDSKQKVLELLKKYRYALLVLLLGVGLMLLPTEKQEASQPSEPAQQERVPDMAERLEELLSQIQGVGKVKVLVTVAAGERYAYQYDEDISVNEGNSAVKKDTVIITDSNKNQQPILQQVLPETYLGAIIVCQGADDAQVKLQIVQAVAAVTGLGANAISVLKMK